MINKQIDGLKNLTHGSVSMQNQDPTLDLHEKHYLFTSAIEVTIEEHLELLASPKKCDKLGLDNTYEREVYSHRHEWYGWPPCPPIDPDEELYCLL